MEGKETSASHLKLKEELFFVPRINSSFLLPSSARSQANPRLSQRPQWENNMNFHIMSLSRRRLGKASLWLEPVPPQMSQGYSFWGPGSSPWAVAISPKAAVCAEPWVLFAKIAWLSSADFDHFSPLQIKHMTLYFLIILPWHESSACERPLGSSYCFCFFISCFLYFLTPVLPLDNVTIQNPYPWRFWTAKDR